MKKYLTLILLLMFIVTGCGNKETKKESSKPQEQRIDKAKFGVEYEWDCEVPLSNIKEFYYQDFLTTDGDFYAYDLYKIFSTTNSHCKKIETNKKFKSFVYGRVLGEDLNIYYYNRDKGEFIIDDYLKNYNNLIKNNETVVFLELIGNNNIIIIEDKKANLYEENYNENGQLIPTKKEIYTFDDDEYFISSSMHIIKTNKAYYKYDIINEKECHKYADIKCEYGLVKDKNLTNAYNDILYADGLFTAFKDSPDVVYTYSMGA